MSTDEGALFTPPALEAGSSRFQRTLLIERGSSVLKFRKSNYEVVILYKVWLYKLTWLNACLLGGKNLCL